VEGKKALDKGTLNLDLFAACIPFDLMYSLPLVIIVDGMPGRLGHHDAFKRVSLKAFLRSTGISITQSWNTADVLMTKVELANTLANGLKAELTNNFSPSKGSKGQKLSLYFQQPQFHTRAFFDLNAQQALTANVDGVIGYEGFLVGGEAGYDVQKAAITRYSASVGYSTAQYNAAILATNNLSIFSALYYQKVNSAVEAGVKASYDVKSSSTVGIEVASKYKIDPLSFMKV